VFSSQLKLATFLIDFYFVMANLQKETEKNKLLLIC